MAADSHTAVAGSHTVAAGTVVVDIGAGEPDTVAAHSLEPVEHIAVAVAAAERKARPPRARLLPLPILAYRYTTPGCRG